MHRQGVLVPASNFVMFFPAQKMSASGLSMAALVHKLLFYMSVKVVVPCMSFTCPYLVTDDGECSPHFSGPSYSNVF